MYAARCWKYFTSVLWQAQHSLLQAAGEADTKTLIRKAGSLSLPADQTAEHLQ